MKKIISLISAIAIMASVSTSAFAATIQVTASSKGLAYGQAPKATLSITRDESVEVDAEGYYQYNLQVDLSDLGTLGTCIVDEYEGVYTYGGVKMFFLEYGIATDQDIKLVTGRNIHSGPNKTTGLATRLASTANGDTYDKGLYLQYSETTDNLHTGYPVTTEAGTTPDALASANSCTAAFTRKILAKPGTTFTVVDAASTVSFKAYGLDENYATAVDLAESVNAKPLTSTVASITLPAVGQPAPETYPIEMTVSEKEDTTTGYIWALVFGANKDKLASLTATFEDGVREAFVANIPAAAVTAVTGGTTTINVGLKTGATLTGATFVAGNSDVNTEATTQVLYK